MTAIVIQTIIVYVFVVYVLYYFTQRANTTNKFRYAIVGVFIYAVIFGLRYGVGTDCLAYINTYEDALKGFTNDRHEAGFTYLIQFFACFNLPTEFFLGFISFMQLFLIFYYFKEKHFLLPFLSLTFVLGCIWLNYANGLRQITAFCIFVTSLKFAEQHNWKILILLIATAITIHSSAILVVPLVPFIILGKNWTPNIKVQYVLLAIAIFLGQTEFINNVMDYIEPAAVVLGYDYYMNDKYVTMLQRESIHYGIGYFINILIPIVIIFNSDILKKEMPSAIKFYNLYFIGLMIRFALFGSPLIQRVNYYLYGFDYIVGAYVLYLLWNKQKKISFNILLASYVLIFFATLYRMFENDSAFYFNWQIDEYMLFTYKIKQLM